MMGSGLQEVFGGSEKIDMCSQSLLYQGHSVERLGFNSFGFEAEICQKNIASLKPESLIPKPLGL